MISSVLPRKTPYMLQRSKELNEILQNLCIINDFIFINQTNIGLEQLASDGVHLNDEGSIRLANNYLDNLNGEL